MNDFLLCKTEKEVECEPKDKCWSDTCWDWEFSFFSCFVFGWILILIRKPSLFQDNREVDRNEGLKFARKHSMLFIGMFPLYYHSFVCRWIESFGWVSLNLNLLVWRRKSPLLAIGGCGWAWCFVFVQPILPCQEFIYIFQSLWNNKVANIKMAFSYKKWICWNGPLK